MREIIVKFKSREDTIVYTRDILPLLITDKDTEYIMDAETGVLLYSTQEGINRKEVYRI